MRRLLLCLPLVLTACPRAPEATPDGGAAVDGAVATVVDAGSKAAAVAPDAGTPPAPAADAKRVVQAWTEALVKHDMAALEKLYAPEVFYYTAPRPRASVLSAKKAVASPGEPYKQEIRGAIEVTENGRRATFTRRWGRGYDRVDTRTALVLSGSPLVITEERDVVRPPGACEDALVSIVGAQPQARAAMARAERALATHPDSHLLENWPERQDDGTTTGAIGIAHPDRFETVVLYNLTGAGPGGGELTISAETDMKVSAADIAKARAACLPKK